MSVRIEKVGNRIHLRSPSPTPGLGRRIPGANFSSHTGAHWSLPLTMESCYLLRAEFGRALEIGPQLTAWARDTLARQEGMGDLGRQRDAELKRVPELYPGLAAAMGKRKYQRVGARFIAEGRQVLIADHPGLGKTLEALAGVAELNIPGPYLVLCPKTAVESVWAREIPSWLPGQHVVTVHDVRAAREQTLNALLDISKRTALSHEPAVRYALQDTWVVLNKEMIRTKSFWDCEECGHRTKVKAGPKKLDCDHEARRAPRVDDHEYPQLFGIRWGVIIADECDKILIRKTGSLTQMRTGAEILRDLDLDGVRIAMSGTPMRGKPQLLWSTLNWLRPKEHTSFWRMAQTFFNATQSGYNGAWVVGELDRDREEWLYKSLDGIMLRRTKAEVAPDLPNKTYVGTRLDPADEGSPVGVWLPMDPAQEKAYTAMARDSEVDLAGGRLTALGVLAELTRLKQFATSAGRMSGTTFVPMLPSNKFDWIVQQLDQWGFPDDPTEKIIIVSQFTEVLDLFEHEIRQLFSGSKKWRAYGSAMLTGKVTGRRRRADTIERFNQPTGSPTEHLLFLNILAGGVAITIDSADHMIVLDETWIPDDHEQVEDRIHRVSRPRPVFYHYLRSLDTVEETIAVVNAQRDRDTKGVLDTRRGIEYTRQVVEAMR